MSDAYNASETAGYRDVCINLRVINPSVCLACLSSLTALTCPSRALCSRFARLKLLVDTHETTSPPPRRSPSGSSSTCVRCS